MTATYIHSGSTTANTVSDITFVQWHSTIEIVNSGNVDMWARVDGTNPTIAGDDCIYIPAFSYVTIYNLEPTSSSTVNFTDVRVISSGVTNFTVSAGV